MFPCIECTQLWNVYTNLRIKYRMAIAAPAGRIADDYLDKLRAASELAQNAFQEHELGHHSKPRVTETKTPPPAPEKRDRQNGAILLPAASQNA
jgi:hypothetical protein